MASAALKPPFRRALYIANFIVRDELVESCYAGLHRMVLLLEGYSFPVIPEILEAKSEQREEEDRKSKEGKSKDGRSSSMLSTGTGAGFKKMGLSGIAGLFGGKKSAGGKTDPLSQLSRMLSMKRIGGSLVQKLHRQRKRAKRKARREKRRSIRMLDRKQAELARQAAADTLCKGGVPTSGPSGMRREHFEPITEYVARMVRCQGHTRRSTELIQEKSKYEIYEKTTPLFHVNLNVQVLASGAAGAMGAVGAVGAAGAVKAAGGGTSAKSSSSSSHHGDAVLENSAVLRFDPPLTMFEEEITKVIHNIVGSVNKWGCVNVDMLMPYEGHKSRDHRGQFEAKKRPTVHVSSDPKVQESVERVRVAMRRANSVLMALVLWLQKYSQFFHFDQHTFGTNLMKAKEESKKKRREAKKRKHLMTFEDEEEDVNTVGGGEGGGGGGGGEAEKKSKNSTLSAELEEFAKNLNSDFERVDICEQFISEMEAVLVDQLDLHSFCVDMRSLKSSMIGNAKMTHALLLRDVQKQCMSICKEMDDRFGVYHKTISSWPKTVEEFDEQMHAVDMFDKTVGSLGSQLARLDLIVVGLEDRKFVPTERDFREIWKSRGWPKRLTEARDKCVKAASSHRARFEEELEQQKKMFKAEVRRLREAFREITQKGPSQWGESESVANDVSNLQRRLNEVSFLLFFLVFLERSNLTKIFFLLFFHIF